MTKVNILFPHQLFEKSSLPLKEGDVYLVEESLFFTQYRFHQQKIAYHRATMKYYEQFLHEQGIKVQYIDSQQSGSDIRKLIPELKGKGVKEFNYIDPVDDWLQQRIDKTAAREGLKIKAFPTPMFLNSNDELDSFFADKKRFYQTDFYIHQRKQRNILLEKDGKPLGGKWSFDAENRKKYPANKKPPGIEHPQKCKVFDEAVEYVQMHFKDNPGELSAQPLYPLHFKAARQWLQQFFTNRFADFGPYEDAIVSGEHFLHHSVLTPMLNNGLLTPTEVLDSTLEYASSHEVPLNSLEGFIRQIIGWREFIRAVYRFKGREERTRNFWEFERKIPEAFYTGNTGIEPLDVVLGKVLKTGYCHHIERLMVLGNFMLLCGIHPDEVYRWFMEMFIDAYDWVMVPNVYGMSQFADGGLMATKPYISGSNYLMKMSDFKKGKWQKVWDGLFWQFMDHHRDFFGRNPRMNMLIRSFDKMAAEKKKAHHEHARAFLMEFFR